MGARVVAAVGRGEALAPGEAQAPAPAVALAPGVAAGEGEASAARPAAVALAWQAWPARARPGQAAAVGVALGAAALGLGAWGGDPLLVPGCLAVLLLSLSRYFLPTRYRLDGEGVEVASFFGRSRRRWSSFRRYASDARGVTLSSYGRRSWLEPYRAVRLLYDRNREAVLAAVAAHLGPQAGGR